MRVEYGPLHKVLDKLIDRLPDGRELVANARESFSNGAKKLAAMARR